jgi:hypothetical protein
MTEVLDLKGSVVGPMGGIVLLLRRGGLMMGGFQENGPFVQGARIFMELFDHGRDAPTQESGMHN